MEQFARKFFSHAAFTTSHHNLRSEVHKDLFASVQRQVANSGQANKRANQSLRQNNEGHKHWSIMLHLHTVTSFLER